MLRPGSATPEVVPFPAPRPCGARLRIGTARGRLDITLCGPRRLRRRATLPPGDPLALLHRLLAGAAG